MTPAEETIASLEQSVHTLLEQYADLQKQVGILNEDKKNMREEIIRSHAELAKLQENYRNLQTAHALLAESPERDKARRQITSIINKIDQISLLIGEPIPCQTSNI